MAIDRPLHPNARLLCKLGAIAVYADQLIRPQATDWDQQRLSALMADTQVIEWREQMTLAGLLPVIRHQPEDGQP